MRTVWLALVVVLLPVWSLLAQQPPAQPPPTSKPETHDSACELADSMAGKLGYKGNLKFEVARQTCQALAPSMKPEDHTSFMRCCLKRLTGTDPGPDPLPTPKKKTKADDSGQKI
jgi:hypothetical protein